MKFIFLFIVAVAPGLLTAQFTLEHNFSEGVVYGHIIEEGEIIYSHSTATGESLDYEVTLTFYNSDFQVIGSSSFTYFTTSSYPYGISRNLFNSDDQIEFLLPVGLIDERSLQLRTINGDVIDEFSDCISMTLLNTNEGVIGIASCYDNVDNSFSRVYSFPGSLPSGIAEQDNSEILPFPNPSKSFINIPTEGVTLVEIFNMMGQKVFEVPTNGSQNQQIPTSQLAPGTYIYQTKSDQEVKPGKMFVVE